MLGGREFFIDGVIQFSGKRQAEINQLRVERELLQERSRMLDIKLKQRNLDEVNGIYSVIETDTKNYFEKLTEVRDNIRNNIENLELKVAIKEAVLKHNASSKEYEYEKVVKDV